MEWLDIEIFVTRADGADHQRLLAAGEWTIDIDDRRCRAAVCLRPKSDAGDARIRN